MEFRFLLSLYSEVVDVHGVRPPRFSKFKDLFKGPSEEDIDHPYTINFLGTKKLLAAMETNNCRKLIRITGSLVGKHWSPFVALFNILLSFTNKWHEQSELAIRASNVDYTVIRPTGIQDEPRCMDTNSSQPRHLILLDGDSGVLPPVPAKISVSDLADLCVLSLKTLKLAKSTVICSSAQGVGPTSWEALVASLSLDKSGRYALKAGPHRLVALTYSSVVISTITLALWFTKTIFQSLFSLFMH